MLMAKNIPDNTENESRGQKIKENAFHFLAKKFVEMFPSHDHRFFNEYLTATNNCLNKRDFMQSWVVQQSGKATRHDKQLSEKCLLEIAVAISQLVSQLTVAYQMDCLQAAILQLSVTGGIVTAQFYRKHKSKDAALVKSIFNGITLRKFLTPFAQYFMALRNEFPEFNWHNDFDMHLDVNDCREWKLPILNIIAYTDSYLKSRSLRDENTLLKSQNHQLKSQVALYLQKAQEMEAENLKLRQMLSVPSPTSQTAPPSASASVSSVSIPLSSHRPQHQVHLNSNLNHLNVNRCEDLGVYNGFGTYLNTDSHININNTNANTNINHNHNNNPPQHHHIINNHNTHNGNGNNNGILNDMHNNNNNHQNANNYFKNESYRLHNNSIVNPSLNNVNGSSLSYSTMNSLPSVSSVDFQQTSYGSPCTNSFSPPASKSFIETSNGNGSLTPLTSSPHQLIHDDLSVPNQWSAPNSLQFNPSVDSAISCVGTLPPSVGNIPSW